MSEPDKTIKLDRDDLQTPQVTVEAFRRLWVESGLHSESDIAQFFAGLPQELRKGNAKPVAQQAVRLGRLTRYQAQAILTGKTKALVLGSYVILDKLGQGGMGQVYRAKHIKMGRVVALKVLPSSAMRTPEAIKRFQKEIQAAAKLSHPNIVTAHDAGESNRIHFLVMEYVEGQDLRAVVRERGPLPVATAVDYILQAARGLEAAHRQGIIHRDIKPENLLLDSAGTVKILDMGLARISDSMDDDAADEASLTRAGQVMGTPDYMAPEQGIDTKRAESRSDIYSLGCTLHMLLLGRTPYRGETLVEKILAHRDRPIPSLMQQRSDIPESLDRLFQAMMAKRLEDRPANIGVVIEALDAIVRSGVAAAKIAPTVTFAAPPESTEASTAVPRGTLATQWPSIEVRPEDRPWTVLKRKPSRWQWIGLIATGLASILVVAGAFALSSAFPRTGIIGLSVNPLGAQVSVLDEAGSQILFVDELAAPRKLELPAKQLQVTISLDGFESYNASIEPVVGAEQSLEVRLKPLEVAKPETPVGSVLIASNKEGAEIELSDATDPDTLLHSFVSGPESTSVDLPPGRYRISATKEGFEAYEAVITVLENSRLRHSVVLTETPQAPEVAVNPVPPEPVEPSPMPMPTPMPTPMPMPDSTPAPSPGPPSWTGWPEGTPAPAIAPFDARTAKKYQQEWAEHLGFGKKRDNYIFTNRLGMRFVLIPPGEFVMGASEEDIALIKKSFQGTTNAFVDVEFWGPQRKVVITRPFFISAHEITRSQFEYVAQQQTGPITALGAEPPNRLMMSELHPFKAFDFCTALAKLEDLPPAYSRDIDFVTIVGTDTYRLPTEAEWEFAARAGTTTRFWFGDDPNLLRAAERVAGSPIEGNILAFTSPQPNAFELYDILGNVAELTFTSFDPKFLQSPVGDILVDPNFKADHGFYTVRGAHYATMPDVAHVAQRYGHRIPDQGPLGIRLVLDVEAARKLKEKR